jgi:hypothetical protein
LNARLVVVLAVVVIVLLAAGFLVTVQQGATSTTRATSTASTESQSSTTIGTSGGGHVNNSQSLQLRLYANASSTGGSAGGAAFQILASEYNTLATASNVTVARDWKLNGLSLGACGTAAYPFGVALYQGYYTPDTVSSAQPLQIYPVVACPMLIRYITGYLFQPMSDLAVVLPSGPNATAIPMSANVTAASEYSGGVALSSTSTALGPGTYTVAAGDEWGSIVLIHFTIGSGTYTSSTSTGTGALGTLQANFGIGPTQPVCMANATTGPAPAPYSSIAAVVTSQQSGQAMTLPISWLSNGCGVSGSIEASLAPGTYSLNLSSCQFMGCSSALPKSFAIVAGLSTSVNISIDTGIR